MSRVCDCMFVCECVRACIRAWVFVSVDACVYANNTLCFVAGLFIYSGR